MRPQVCVGVCAIFWSIWLCRNDVVFYEKRLYSYLQVIFRTTYWTRFWTILQKEKDSEFEACVSHIGDCVYGDLR
jgi:hypothetical protein